MKRCILFLSLFLCIHSIAQEENRVVMTKLIVYKVLNESFTSEQNTEAVKLFNILTDTNVIYHYDCYEWNPLIDNKYKYDDGEHVYKLSNKEVRSSIYVKTIKTLQHPSKPNDYYDSIIYRDYSIEDFYAFSFSERWEYDTVDFKFYKKANAIAPMVSLFNSQKELMGYVTLLHFLLNNNTSENVVWSIKNVQYDVCINEYFSTGECFSNSWSVYENIEATDRYDFMEYVFSSIDNASIKAYKDKNKTIEVNSVNEFIEYNYDTLAGQYFDTIIMSVYDISLNEFSHLRFIEDWCFDVENQCFMKKVKAIGFVREEWDKKTFKSKGYRPLFWVFFD